MKILLFIFCLISSSFSLSAIDLLPATDEITGWEVDTLPGCVRGTAFDSASLYSKIDGGAEEYTSRGMVDAAFGGYSDGNQKLCIEIYNQATSANARDLYAFFGTGMYQTYDAIGDSARMDISLPFDIVFECIQDSFFCRIRIADVSPVYVQAAQDFAAAIMGRAIGVERGMAGKQDLFPQLSCFPDPVTHGCIFTLPAVSQTTLVSLLKIFDCSGRLVCNLSGTISNGVILYPWNGSLKKGRLPVPGIYLAMTQVDGKRLAKRFVIK